MLKMVNNVGRPSKLTHDLKAKLLTAIELTDLPMDRIAPHVGITKQSYYAWLKKGETILRSRSLADDDQDKIDESTLSEHELLCADLYEEVQLAYTAREDNVLSEIKMIAKRRGDWRAYQWLLKIWNEAYRTADLIPEPEPEEEDWDEDDMFTQGAPHTPEESSIPEDDEDEEDDYGDEEEKEFYEAPKEIKKEV